MTEQHIFHVILDALLIAVYVITAFWVRRRSDAELKWRAERTRELILWGKPAEIIRLLIEAEAKTKPWKDAS